MAKLSVIEKPVFVVTDNNTLRLEVIDDIVTGYNPNEQKYWLRIEWGEEGQCSVLYDSQAERDQDYTNLQKWLL